MTRDDIDWTEGYIILSIAPQGKEPNNNEQSLNEIKKKQFLASKIRDSLTIDNGYTTLVDNEYKPLK